MTTATKAPAPRDRGKAGPWPPSAWAAPPLTTEDRLKCIEALGERIAGYVRFMSAVGTLNGSSKELKERAVAAFYEQLALTEGQLRRIQDDLRLG
jgi:3-deoxy-D-arabino-heptulosonate 7-phosphate (DAHP) synthase class II